MRCQRTCHSSLFGPADCCCAREQVAVILLHNAQWRLCKGAPRRRRHLEFVVHVRCALQSCSTLRTRRAFPRVCLDPLSLLMFLSRTNPDEVSFKRKWDDAIARSADNPLDRGIERVAFSWKYALPVSEPLTLASTN